MNKTKNIGLYLSNTSDKSYIIKQIMDNRFLLSIIDLSPMRGALFSTITIEQFIDDEFRHDHFLIHNEENDSLQTMSSGQQKKALLSYLIAQQPEYLVLDDVYGNIDKEAQASVTQKLAELAETTLLIQLFFRKRDMLPAIDEVYTVDENNTIINRQAVELFIKDASVHETDIHRFSLPKQYADNHIDIDPLIQLNDVSVHYGEKQVLNNVNWTIRTGEFWQLVGPNGSGKTTLLSMITGDNPRSYGQNMMLFGRKKGSGETIWDIKRQIGYFTPSMTERFTRVDSVENMIISGLMDSVGLYIQPTDMQKDMAKGWLEMLGSSFRNKSFQSLSMGQQRMVMVARAMVKHPPLLILDEPTTELDDENSGLFIEMVNAIAKEEKIAILYVSHRDEEGLQPGKIYELIPTDKGYTGIEKQVKS